MVSLNIPVTNLPNSPYLVRIGTASTERLSKMPVLQNTSFSPRSKRASFSGKYSVICLPAPQPQKSPFFPEVMLSFWRNTGYSFMWSRSKQALEVSVMSVFLHGCVCMLTSRECKVGLVFYGHQVVFVELCCSFYCPLICSRAQRVLTVPMRQAVSEGRRCTSETHCTTVYFNLIS